MLIGKWMIINVLVWGLCADQEVSSAQTSQVSKTCEVFLLRGLAAPYSASRSFPDVK
jgi:hypothetical protein